MTSSARPGYSDDRASSREAIREVTMISSALARRKCSTCAGLLTSTTVRTWGAIDSIAITARIERMSASLVGSAGHTTAAIASSMPARLRSSPLVTSPLTK